MVSAYFIEDTLTRPVVSALPVPDYDPNNCFPRERYQQIGFCEYDFRDQFLPEDDPGLKRKFPIYRDVWAEEGTVPEECGGPGGDAEPTPMAWKSLEAKIVVGWVAWDKPDNIVPVTGAMTKETEPDEEE